MKYSIEKYNVYLKRAIQIFWDTRQKQKGDNKKSNRSAVTGGKQLDGFLVLFTQIAIDLGIPNDCIYTKSNQLPGFFRPTKNWDFLIISPSKKLIAVLEFKSQVGSFGNNFNNRTEEALGSAVDLWTAFRENVFPNQQAPSLGYLMVLEKTEKSTRPIKIRSPYFEVLPEFKNTSYTDRYVQFCKKLMLERHYSGTTLISTSPDKSFSIFENELSFDSFLYAFIGHLQGKINEFK